VTGSAGCPFCRIVAGQAPAHVVWRDDRVVAFLDRRPLLPGHVLVVPVVHRTTLFDVPTEDLGPLLQVVQRLGVAVERATGAEGVFVGINNRVSQSVPHLHVHVVPRRKGDGLRGFFWPRRPYRDEAHAAEVCAAIRAALSPEGGVGHQSR